MKKLIHRQVGKEGKEESAERPHDKISTKKTEESRNREQSKKRKGRFPSVQQLPQPLWRAWILIRAAEQD